MTKITGNELIMSSEPNSSNQSPGIPIRLQIAATILSNSINWKDLHPYPHDIVGAINVADELIAAYNNTPNPNE